MRHMYARISSSFPSRCGRTWNWELALTLQEGGVGVDELVGWDIADGDTRHIGGIDAALWVEKVLSVERALGDVVCGAEACKKARLRLGILEWAAWHCQDF